MAPYDSSKTIGISILLNSASSVQLYRFKPYSSQHFQSVMKDLVLASALVVEVEFDLTALAAQILLRDINSDL